MSQVVHDKYAQMVKVDDVDLIPAAIVAAQTRDGKDELIVGAGAMVLDSGSGMWLPVSAANRLPVEATLTGQNLPFLVVHQTVTGVQVADGATVAVMEGVD